MNKYVVGFAFSEDGSKILLIRKNRPEWMKGLLNGVGGHMEKGESPLKAMYRECKEETGLTQLIWIYKCLLTGSNKDGQSFECHVFYAYSQHICHYRQVENELMMIYKVIDLPQRDVVPNLTFLIPYGRLDDGSTFMKVLY